MAMPPDWECVGVSEIDKYACQVIRLKKPDVKNYGDIEKIRYEKLPDFNALIGGSPCQDLSLAGKRKGLTGLRSRLFYSYLAILKVKKPDYFIFENVKGLLSSNQGWDFAEVIDQFTEAGYDCWWQVLDATWYGIPQHRERVFIFGTLRDRGFRQVFLEPGNSGSNTKLQRPQGNTLRSLYREKSNNGSYIIESELDPQANSLRSRYKGWGDRGSFVIEKVHSDKDSIRNRIYSTNGVAPALHRKTGGQMVKKIAVPVASRGRNPTGGWQQTFEFRKDGNANALTKVTKDNMVAMPVLEPAFETTGANGRRVKRDDEPSFTLRRGVHNGVSDGMAIRYLTPLECERLMGWPDDHTKWGIDDKGNKVELSDNARYNLIGNGVVPQQVRPIIEHIMV